MTAIPRRSFIRTLAGSAAALATAPGALLGQASHPPNVVFLLTDDQGSVDVNCYGATDLITPNMDAIAAHGVRFTDFYVSAPMCTASRASLLTGRYFQHVLSEGGLAEETVSMGELFQNAGYKTAFFGKWHLGGPPSDPLGQGFDEFVGHRVGAIDNYSHFAYWQSPPRHALYRGRQQYREDGTYFPDIVVRESRDFIARHRDEPFYLFCSFNQPHYPLQPEEKFLRMYDHVAGNRRIYGASLTSLDDKIGQILAALDETGVRDNTIIVLLSDNGHSEEKDSEGGGGSAGPFRGAKKTLWEGGIRMPCIVSYPGHIPAGQTRRQVGSAMDWLPTLAHYCGISTAGLPLDGRDLSRVLADPAAPSPHPILHWMIGSTYWAVREGPWKAVSLQNEMCLTNLDRDPGESQNLATTEPVLAGRMRLLHQQWLDSGIKPLYTIE